MLQNVTNSRADSYGPGATSAAVSGASELSSSRLSLAPARNQYRFAYVALLLFAAVYFGRPEDWVPGLVVVPIAKIVAATAIAAFLLGFLGVRKLFVPTELWLLFGLFAQLCLAIPFSSWKGGSFDTVVIGFGKIVLITLLLVQTVNSFPRLRKLLFVQTMAVVVVSAISAFINVKTIGSTGRVIGALGGIFGNPNDLASIISLVFPFGIAFLLATKDIIRKVFWFSALSVLSFALMRTYSRGGFLSMMVVLVASAFFFGRKAQRVIALILVIAVPCILIAGISGAYGERLATIVAPSTEASSVARQELFWRSVELAARHPLFGVGPGQFAELSGNWHVAHNSYTELAAEAGLMASIFFIWMMLHTYRKVLRARRYLTTPDLKVFCSAIAASMTGFFVTLLFSSVEYEFYPYFLIAYGGIVAALSINDAALPTTISRDSSAGLSNEPEHPKCVV